MEASLAVEPGWAQVRRLPKVSHPTAMETPAETLVKLLALVKVRRERMHHLLQLLGA